MKLFLNYPVISMDIIVFTENMHLILEQQLNQPGVNVWGGISSSGVYGPFFFWKER